MKGWSFPANPLYAITFIFLCLFASFTSISFPLLDSTLSGRNGRSGLAESEPGCTQ